jgi:hypothetical protein
VLLAHVLDVGCAAFEIRNPRPGIVTDVKAIRLGDSRVGQQGIELQRNPDGRNDKCGRS